MRKIDRLKKEAKESALFREHKMSSFYYCGKENGREHWIAECVLCDDYIVVCNKPKPNEIEIEGPAVALYCGRKGKQS